MSQNTYQDSQRRHTGIGLVAAGMLAGIAFTGWLLKAPTPVVHAAPAAPAAAIDYDRITAAVKAAFPVAPAAVAAPAVKAAPAAPAKRKIVKAAAPAAVVYYVVPRPACSCML